MLGTGEDRFLQSLENVENLVFSQHQKKKKLIYISLFLLTSTHPSMQRSVWKTRVGGESRV